MEKWGSGEEGRGMHIHVVQECDQRSSQYQECFLSSPVSGPLHSLLVELSGPQHLTVLSIFQHISDLNIIYLLICVVSVLTWLYVMIVEISCVN